MRQEIVNTVESIINKYGMGLGRFGMLERAYSSVLRAIKPQEILVSVNDYKMYVNMQMGGISAELYRNHIWEPIETMLFQNAVKSLKPGDCVIDVGANIGYYTIMAAGYLNGGVVYSFDPDDGNLKLLRKNIAVNGIENVRIYPVAVSNKDEMASYYQSGCEAGCHNIVGSHNLKPKGLVQTRMLDNLHLFEIGLIKIDVEGAEMLVLEGAKRLLQKSHPVLFIECWDEGLRQSGYTALELIEEIESMGYDKIIVIDEIRRCFEPYSREGLQRHFERESDGLNFLCLNCKEERKA